MTTGTTVYSWVTVVAPKTRIDLALPSDVAVADLVPMLLEMAKEFSPDGGAKHGGWGVARLGGDVLDPGRTLAAQGVVDGDLLHLVKRTEQAPPPLFDDVVDAIAETLPDSYRPWTKQTANRIGLAGAGIALFGAAVAALMSGPIGGGSNMGTAIAAGAAAVAALVLGAVFARVYQAAATGVVIAGAGALPMAFVSGLYLVPGEPGRPALLLASTLVLVVSVAATILVGSGIVAFVAAGMAAGLGAVTFGVAALVAHPAPGIAAGVVAVSLMVVSMLPRLTIRLARLPLPRVPANPEEVDEDEDGALDYSALEERTSLAHEYMTGVIIGAGVVAAIGSVVTATKQDGWSLALAGVAMAALLLRSRTYANRSQSVALLGTGMLGVAGIAAGWLFSTDPADRLLWVVGGFLVLAVAALVLGVVIPEKRFTPPLRRAVEVFEAICITLVLPLSFAVMGLFSVMRQLHG